jgi:hypothetical protein
MINTLTKSLLSIALFAGVSQAATSWTVPAGSGNNIDYSAGQTENGLFTDSSPTVGGDTSDTFLFFPNNFIASDEGSNYVTDTLSFVATAKPGQKLTRIAAGLNGDWSILGSGMVDGNATLTLTNINTSAVLSQSLTFSPTLPSSSEEGTFTGFGEIVLPEGWLNAKVELTTNLAINGGNVPGIVYQDGGFAGAIQLKGASVDIQAAPVPLPGALAAAPFAMGIAWYARRRMSK